MIFLVIISTSSPKIINTSALQGHRYFLKTYITIHAYIMYNKAPTINSSDLFIGNFGVDFTEIKRKITENVKSNTICMDIKFVRFKLNFNSTKTKS